jgi:outer membrane receptor protein involved in Fe transport
MGSMFSDDADTYRLGGWTTFRGAVSYTRNRWEWSVNAENLFNRHRYFMGADYEDQVYPGAPISAYASIRFRFR